MRFKRRAQLDPSQVSDRRGAKPMLVGGGGVVGVIVVLITLFLNQGGEVPSTLNIGQEGPGLSESCRTGEDANQSQDCRIVAVINSVQEFWSENLDGYREAQTVFFSGATNTGCGNASSAVGPFYCPLDSTIYIDLTFYDALRERFGAQGGPFAEAYVIAHEYGHHVENLLGILDRARSRESGPQSEAVRVELMADCLSGMWGRGAVDTQFVEELTDADIRDGLDAAAAVGDDRIQSSIGGRVNPETWTHGSAESRQKWFRIGYQSSTIERCDTFSPSSV